MLRHTSCHVLRRVLVRLPAKAAGQKWITHTCDMPLSSVAERASGVCRSCASGWSHPEDRPLVPVLDAAVHARFSLRHWQAMQEQAETPADRARAAEGITVWTARVAALAQLTASIAKEPGLAPVYRHPRRAASRHLKAVRTELQSPPAPDLSKVIATMSKATNTHTTPHRGLLAATPTILAMSGAAVALAAQKPDEELIALCAAYVVQARAFCTVGQHTWDMPVDDPEYIRCEELARAMVPGMHALEAQITDTPARTVKGLLAKAEAARHSLSGDADRDIGPMDPGNALTWSLIQEMLVVLGSAS